MKHCPWEKISTDFFELHGKYYLVLVDYYSNFVEVEHLTTTTREHVIIKCKSQFGSQTFSEKFRLYAQMYQFHDKTSSPYHPQSTGKPEKT
jgi:hypothetical protein